MVFYGYSGFLTNKTHRHDKAEILLKVALNTIMETIILVHYPDSELTSLYSYFFMLCSSREAANTYLIVFVLFPPGLETTIYYTLTITPLTLLSVEKYVGNKS